MLANSNFARGAPTTLRSAKDQTAHTYVKYRKAGQASAADVAAKDLKRELEEKERQHFEQVRRDWERKKGLAAVAALGAGAGGAVALLEDRAGSSGGASSAAAGAVAGAAAHSDVDAALAAFDDADDDEALDRLAAAEGDGGSDDDADDGAALDDGDDDDEDDTAELMRELERIKREREEERARKERELAELASKETTEAILKGNPLLTKGTASALGSAGSSSAAAAAVAPAAGGVKRRFGDDTVFSHTHANEPETRKRFLNDSIRSDFHRSFMRRFFA
jgi:protein CWC15